MEGSNGIAPASGGGCIIEGRRFSAHPHACALCVCLCMPPGSETACALQSLHACLTAITQALWRGHAVRMKDGHVKADARRRLHAAAIAGARNPHRTIGARVRDALVQLMARKDPAQVCTPKHVELRGWGGASQHGQLP